MLYIYDNWYWTVCLMVVTEILTIFVYKCLLNDLHDLVWETHFAAEMAFIELWEQYQRPERDWNKANKGNSQFVQNDSL